MAIAGDRLKAYLQGVNPPQNNDPLDEETKRRMDAFFAERDGDTVEPTAAQINQTPLQPKPLPPEPTYGLKLQQVDPRLEVQQQYEPAPNALGASRAAEIFKRLALQGQKKEIPSTQNSKLKTQNSPAIGSLTPGGAPSRLALAEQEAANEERYQNPELKLTPAQTAQLNTARQNAKQPPTQRQLRLTPEETAQVSTARQAQAQGKPVAPLNEAFLAGTSQPSTESFLRDLRGNRKEAQAAAQKDTAAQIEAGKNMPLAERLKNIANANLSSVPLGMVKLPETVAQMLGQPEAVDEMRRMTGGPILDEIIRRNQMGAQAARNLPTDAPLWQHALNEVVDMGTYVAPLVAATLAGGGPAGAAIVGATQTAGAGGTPIQVLDAALVNAALIKAGAVTSPLIEKGTLQMVERLAKIVPPGLAEGAGTIATLAARGTEGAALNAGAAYAQGERDPKKLRRAALIGFIITNLRDPRVALLEPMLTPEEMAEVQQFRDIEARATEATNAGAAWQANTRGLPPKGGFPETGTPPEGVPTAPTEPGAPPAPNVPRPAGQQTEITRIPGAFEDQTTGSMGSTGPEQGQTAPAPVTPSSPVVQPPSINSGVITDPQRALAETIAQLTAGRQQAQVQQTLQQVTRAVTQADQMVQAAQNPGVTPETAKQALTQAAADYQASLKAIQTSPQYKQELANPQPGQTPLADQVNAIQQKLEAVQNILTPPKPAKPTPEQRAAEQQQKKQQATAEREQKKQDELAAKEQRRQDNYQSALDTLNEAQARAQEAQDTSNYKDAIEQIDIQRAAIPRVKLHLPDTPDGQKEAIKLQTLFGQLGDLKTQLNNLQRGGKGKTSPVPRHEPLLSSITNPEGGVPVAEPMPVNFDALTPDQAPLEQGETRSLEAWIHKQGGIQPTGYNAGDEAALRAMEGGRPGLINRRGTPADTLREMANEEGYGPFETVDEFMRALIDRGKTSFPVTGQTGNREAEDRFAEAERLADIASDLRVDSEVGPTFSQLFDTRTRPRSSDLARLEEVARLKGMSTDEVDQMIEMGLRQQFGRENEQSLATEHTENTEKSQGEVLPSVTSVTSVANPAEEDALADWESFLDQARAEGVPADKVADAERIASALIELGDDQITNLLLDRALAGDDRAAEHYITIAENSYGIDRETAEGIIESARNRAAIIGETFQSPRLKPSPESTARQLSGRAAQEVAPSEQPAVSPPERAADGSFGLSEEDRTVLRRQPEDVPDSEYEAWYRHLEDVRNREIRGLVEFNDKQKAYFHGTPEGGFDDGLLARAKAEYLARRQMGKDRLPPLHPPKSEQFIQHGYEKLIEGNQETVANLRPMNVDSEEAAPLIAELRMFALENRINPRHIENLLSEIRNEQLHQGSETQTAPVRSLQGEEAPSGGLNSEQGNQTSPLAQNQPVNTAEKSGPISEPNNATGPTPGVSTPVETPDKPLREAEKMPRVSKTVPPFFSQLQRTIETKMPVSASTAQLAAIIRNPQNGIKEDEINWSGLDDLIHQRAAQSKPISKKEVLDYLRANDVQVQEVEKNSKEYPSWDEVFQDVREKAAEYGEDLGKWEDYDEGVWKSGFENETDAEVLARAVNRIPGVRARVFTHEGEPAVGIGARPSFPHGQTVDDTKFSQYALPGAEPGSYRELLLTLPGEKTKHRSMDDIDRDIDALHEAGSITEDPDLAARYDVLIRERINTQNGWNAGEYRGSHFDESNVLAHVRFNDRTDADGKRVLFIEEIQSDWHQAGRKGGYQERNPVSPEVSAPDTTGWSVETRRENQFTGQRDIVIRGAGGQVVSSRTGFSGTDAEAIRDAATTDVELQQRQIRAEQTKGVPAAPFSKTWHELALKRMLRYAAENGYDRLAWTTGEQQNARYDLSKQIDVIEYERTENGNYDLRAIKDGHYLDLNGLHDVAPEKLPDVVGKDVADRILADQGEVYERDSMRQIRERGKPVEAFQPGGRRPGWYLRYENGAEMGTWPSKESAESDAKQQAAMIDAELPRRLSGNDLKVGGSGMKGFYDQIVPGFLSKYGKKWGAKVGKSEIETEKYGSGHHYEGPDHTIKEVEAIIKSGKIVGAGYNAQAQELLADMKNGMSFARAIEFQSDGLAEDFGGRLYDIAKKEEVHSLDITPSMKKSVIEEGQPLFERNPKWDVPRMHEGVSADDVAANARAEFHPHKGGQRQGVLWINQQTAWAVWQSSARAGVSVGGGFSGLSLPVRDINPITRELDRLGQEIGTPEAVTALREVAMQLQKAASDPQRRSNYIVLSSIDRAHVTRSTMGGQTREVGPLEQARATVLHERGVHGSQAELGGGDPFNAIQGDWLINLPEIDDKVTVALGEMGYRDDEVLVEAPAWSAQGRFDEIGLNLDEATELLDAYFNQVYTEHGEAGLDVFIKNRPGHFARTIISRQKEKTHANQPRPLSERIPQAGRGRETPGPGETGIAQRSERHLRESSERGRTSGGARGAQEVPAGAAGQSRRAEAGFLNPFAKAPYKNPTTPLRDLPLPVLDENRPLRLDVSKLETETLKAIHQAFTDGTLPFGRAIRIIGKVSQRATNPLVTKQVKFVKGMAQSLLNMQTADALMQQELKLGRRGSEAYEQAKKAITDAQLELRRDISKIGPYSKPTEYATTAVRSALLSGLHIPLMNVLEQIATFPFHEGAKTLNFLFPYRMLKRAGVDYKAPGFSAAALLKASRQAIADLPLGLMEAGINAGETIAEKLTRGATGKPERVKTETAQVIKYGESERQLLENAAREQFGKDTRSGAEKFEIHHRPKNIPGLDQALIGVLRTQGIADIPGAIQIFTTSISAQANQLAEEVARQMAAAGQKMTKQQIDALRRDLAYEPSAQMVMLAGDEAARFRHDVATLPYQLIQQLRFPQKEGFGMDLYRLFIDAGLVPFSKIPSAAGRAMIMDYTPLGLIARTAQLRRGVKKFQKASAQAATGGQPPPPPAFELDQAQDLVQRWRQGLLGSLVLLAMGALGWYLWDKYTGGRDDRKKIADLQEALGENYDPELQVGPYAASLGRFGVIGRQASALAGAVKAGAPRTNPLTGEPEGNSPVLRGAYQLGKRTVFDLPLTKSLQDKFQAIDAAKTGSASAVRGVGRAFIPGIFQELAKNKTGFKVEPDSKGSIAGDFKQTVKQSLPGTRSEMQPKLDVMGREIPETNPFFPAIRKREQGTLAERLQELKDMGVGLPKPERKQGESAADYNARVRMQALQNRLQMIDLKTDQDVEGLDRETKRQVYARSLTSGAMDRAEKLSDESVETERMIEADRARAYAMLRTTKDYNELPKYKRDEVRKIIDEGLKEYRARVASGRSGEKAATRPEIMEVRMLVVDAISEAKRMAK